MVVFGSCVTLVVIVAVVEVPVMLVTVVVDSTVLGTRMLKNMSVVMAGQVHFRA